jgi:hypothetical protein
MLTKKWSNRRMFKPTVRSKVTGNWTIDSFVGLFTTLTFSILVNTYSPQFIWGGSLNEIDPRYPTYYVIILAVIAIITFVIEWFIETPKGFSFNGMILHVCLAMWYVITVTWPSGAPVVAIYGLLLYQFIQARYHDIS